MTTTARIGDVALGSPGRGAPIHHDHPALIDPRRYAWHAHAVAQYERRANAALLRRLYFGARCETCGEAFAWMRGSEFASHPRSSGLLLYQAARDHCDRLTHSTSTLRKDRCAGPVVVVRRIDRDGPIEKVEGKAEYVASDASGDRSADPSDPSETPSFRP